MINDEIDENEYYQQDFTTASEWEIFNARLEEIFHEWKLDDIDIGIKLSKNELVLGEWKTISENINFADVDLIVSRYEMVIKNDDTDETTDPETSNQNSKELPLCQAFVDIIATENDYCISDNQKNCTIHELARWYGLRDFVTITPVKTSLRNESQIRVLMSSIHIAISESNCLLPVFLQVLDDVQKVYLGVCEYQATRLSFDIIHLQNTPTTCKYLTGLLDMFKGKISVKYIDPVTVTVRISYCLNKFLNTTYSAQRKYAFSDEDMCDDNMILQDVLPFGVSLDPIKDILLHCTWPEIPENVVVDSQTYSDFNPLLAPVWSILAKFEETPVCYLSECIHEYLQITESNNALSEYYNQFSYNLYAESNPLDLLTESKIPSISTALSNLTSKKNEISKIDGPLNSDQLRQMLYYMFPDAHPRSLNQYQNPESENFDPMKIKSGSVDSLVHRISSLLALCNYEYGGKTTMVQLWAEFTQEMRYRVERCIQIPGVANGFPDSRTCLLHQKLQMLNICMERRRIREGGLPFAMTSQTRRKYQDGNDSDDEFFDCSDDEDETKKAKHAPWNQPVGRLSRLNNMLLVGSDEPLYIPITQEPVPKTEDQLEDDAEVMLKLGPGSELCAQMMSASLLSDMESFKAANPAGQLEDFIRWYSPRDWIEDSANENEPFGRVGKLSSRMLIPGNTWQTVWQQAKPVPARRQKRLFDDTKEAEKVLHYFESRTVGQICQLTMSSLFHAALQKLESEANADADIIPNYHDTIKKLISTCCKLSREDWVKRDSKTPRLVSSVAKWEQLMSDIANVEHSISQIRSLRNKFFAADCVLQETDIEFLSTLMKSFEAELKEVINGNDLEETGNNQTHSPSLHGEKADGTLNNIKRHILNVLKKAQAEQHHENTEINVGIIMNPVEKQFILRLSGKTINNRPGGPQFLRAILGQNEFRLCGAFSQDTTFI